jgi:hypothetical protein
MRAWVIIAVLLVLTGCSYGGNDAGRTNATTASRIERCTQHFLDRVKTDRGAMVRSYVERTYCGPFARKGWVYSDGTLSIKAHLWLVNGYACSAGTSTPGGQTTTMPCDPHAAALDPLECGILHNVRRDEVRAYIRKLKRSQSVKCDDGTTLDELGAT